MNLSDGAWYAVAGVVMATAVALFVWSLWGDRSRGRLRCPRCWYRMEGVTPAESDGEARLLCPECGRHIRSESKLRKNRRRWRWLVVACILLPMALAAGGWPIVRREGWNLITTLQLVELVPIGGIDGPFGRELQKRLGFKGGSWMVASYPPTEERAAIARRMAEGNWLARPMSERWRKSYGALIHFAGTSPLTFRDWAGSDGTLNTGLVDALRTWYDLPPDVAFRTRPKWPEGYHLWVEIGTRTYWPWPTSVGIELRRAGSDTEFTDKWPNDGFLCKEREAATGVARFEVRITQARQAEMELQNLQEMPRIELERRIVEIPYTIGGKIEEIIKPVSSPALDDMVKAIPYEVGEGWNFYNTFAATGGTAKGVAFGLVLEFYLDGSLMARERRWWSGTPSDPNALYRSSGSEWVALESPPANFKSPWDAKPGEKWLIKVTSDPETALRVTDCDRYWQGSFEIPITIIP